MRVECIMIFGSRWFTLWAVLRWLWAMVVAGRWRCRCGCAQLFAMCRQGINPMTIGVNLPLPPRKVGCLGESSKNKTSEY